MAIQKSKLISGCKNGDGFHFDDLGVACVSSSGKRVRVLGGGDEGFHGIHGTIIDRCQWSPDGRCVSIDKFDGKVGGWRTIKLEDGKKKDQALLGKYNLLPKDVSLLVNSARKIMEPFVPIYPTSFGKERRRNPDDLDYDPLVWMELPIPSDRPGYPVFIKRNDPVYSFWLN